MKKKSPPILAQRFFSWYCKNELHDPILGDLDEKFKQNLTKYGLFKARLFYWIDVIQFLNRYTLRRKSRDGRSFLLPLFMVKMNLKSSLRFLKRNRRYTVTNMTGITIGLTSFLLILYYVDHEFSFDRFHQNNENIYRINFSFSDNDGNVSTLVNSPPSLSPLLPTEFPEVIRSSRLRYVTNSLLSYEENQFYEDHGYYADSSFLEIFSFELLHGDKGTALDKPNSIVITQSLSEKLFNQINSVGKTIVLNKTKTVEVTGVLEDLPLNSHLDFNHLISFSTYEVPTGYASDLTSQSWLGFLTYALLEDQSDSEQFQTKLEEYYKDITPDGIKPMKPIVQNLSDIYLGSLNMDDDLASHIRIGSRTNLYLLAVIAFFLLLIVVFNFSNLTSAVSLTKSKSVGVKKTLGAQRGSLIFQMLMETSVLAFICLIFSYVISIILFPEVAKVLKLDYRLQYTDVLKTLPLMILITVVIGIVSGVFPALLLSGSNILKSLRGELKSGKGSFRSKNALIILQFAISIGLISATIVFVKQINYMRSYSTGFNKENVIVVKLLPEDMANYYTVYKKVISQNSSILGVSRSERVVGDPWPFSMIRNTNESPEESKRVYFNLADFDYFKSMGIDIEEGRSFAASNRTDSLNSIIINNKAAELLGLDNPVGNEVYFFDLNGPRKIIGVVDNFNYTSLHQDIGPAVMIIPFIDLEFMYIRISPGNQNQKITYLEETWKEIAEGTPLVWSFLDDKLDQLYDTEESLGTLISGFSILAVFLASLGLYGIVAIVITGRIKEFGIRKVLGASAISIYTLFVKPYIYQVFLAFALILPLLHYLLNTWLQEFAFRIEIAWWIYPLSAVIILSIALVTISFQTSQVAKMKPSNVLRRD